MAPVLVIDHVNEMSTENQFTPKSRVNWDT
jgi:hypothetical protein